MKRITRLAAIAGTSVLVSAPAHAATPSYGQLQKENAQLRAALTTAIDKQVRVAPPDQLWILLTRIYARFPDNGFNCPVMWSKSSFSSGKTKSFDFTRSSC